MLINEKSCNWAEEIKLGENYSSTMSESETEVLKFNSVDPLITTKVKYS